MPASTREKVQHCRNLPEGSYEHDVCKWLLKRNQVLCVYRHLNREAKKTDQGRTNVRVTVSVKQRACPSLGLISQLLKSLNF